MTKAGRNDPCPCGSGKKFKKCCERNMIKGKFLASKMQKSSSKMSSFFTQNVSQQTPFTLKGKNITVTSKQNPPAEKPPELPPEVASNEEKKSDEENT